MGQIRQTDSKRKLKEAFIQILAKQNYETISISEIAQQAGFNRGTFYLNYLNKQDLLSEIVDNFLLDLQKILDEDVVNDDGFFADVTIEKVAHYVQDHYLLAKVLIGSNLSLDLHQKFMGMLRQSFVKRHADFHSKQVPDDYAQVTILSGVVAVFYLWINKGMPESIAQLTEIIRNYSRLSPKEILTQRN